jgi:hypothetical protein
MTTWTPATSQSETWTEEAQPVRVFDPYVFDNAPIFDTGSTAGVWTDKTIQSETWTAE